MKPGGAFHYQIRSEADSIKVLALRHLLTLCGWIKKQKNSFSLTRKGRSILAKGFSAEQYLHLFKTYTRKFNWAFQDLYSEFWIIQGGFLFSLHLLRLKAADFVDEMVLADSFIQAFAAVL